MDVVDDVPPDWVWVLLAETGAAELSTSRMAQDVKAWGDAVGSVVTASLLTAGLFLAVMLLLRLRRAGRRRQLVLPDVIDGAGLADQDGVRQGLSSLARQQLVASIAEIADDIRPRLSSVGLAHTRDDNPLPTDTALDAAEELLGLVTALPPEGAVALAAFTGRLLFPVHGAQALVTVQRRGDAGERLGLTVELTALGHQSFPPVTLTMWEPEAPDGRWSEVHDRPPTPLADGWVRRYGQVGRRLAALGYLEEAARYLREALREGDGTADGGAAVDGLRAALARTVVGLRGQSGARAAFQEGERLRRAGLSAAAAHQHGRLLPAERRMDGLRAWSIVLGLTPGDRAASWRALGQLYRAHDLHLEEEARSMLRRAAEEGCPEAGRELLAWQDEHADALVGVASDLTALGMMADAERLVRRALELRPGHAGALAALVATPDGSRPTMSERRGGRGDAVERYLALIRPMMWWLAIELTRVDLLAAQPPGLTAVARRQADSRIRNFVGSLLIRSEGRFRPHAAKILAEARRHLKQSVAHATEHHPWENLGYAEQRLAVHRPSRAPALLRSSADCYHRALKELARVPPGPDWSYVEARIRLGLATSLRMLGDAASVEKACDMIEELIRGWRGWLQLRHDHAATNHYNLAAWLSAAERDGIEAGTYRGGCATWHLAAAALRNPGWIEHLRGDDDLRWRWPDARVRLLAHVVWEVHTAQPQGLPYGMALEKLVYTVYQKVKGNDQHREVYSDGQCAGRSQSPRRR